MRGHALVVLLLVAASLDAQPDPDGPGLDLLVLVDRSASMWGSRGVPDVLPRLALDLVARDAETNRLCHRFGIISFSSSARIDVPLTAVCGGSVDGLRRAVGRLRPPGSVGETNVIAGLMTARRAFVALPSLGERRRAVVLLTDGVPYVHGRDEAAYARDLRDFVAAELPATFSTLDVLLLPSRFSRDPALWNVLSSNRAEKVTGERDVQLAGVHRLVTRLLGNRSAEATDALVVPPYLSVIVFDILRPSHDVDVAVFAPGAQRPVARATPGTAAMGLGEALMTVVVQRPMAGRWTFRKSDPSARVRILSQEFFPRGRLIAPEPTEPRRMHERVGITYSIVDADGAPVDELPGYPLSLQLSLRRPNGAYDRLPMERDPLPGRTVFRSLDEATCDLAGRYWTEVVIRTVDGDRRAVDVFRDRWSGFTVEDGEAMSAVFQATPAAMIAAAPRSEGEQSAISLAERIGLPGEFQNVLLLVALLLTLAPYLSDAKIGGLQVPALGARKRRVMKVVGPVALLCAIGLVVPLAAFARPSARLEILAVDVTEAGEIDVAIANRGTASVLLTKIELEVVSDRHRSSRPVLSSTAKYRIAVGGLATGGRSALAVRHLLAPDSIERILISPETTRALDLRLHIHASNGVVLRSDVRLGPAP